MAGPISGTWKANSTTAYVDPARWGNGINPIHSHRTGEGRNIAPGSIAEQVPEELTDPYTPAALGYTPEDEASVLWGYGNETGTADRPSLDASDSNARVATMTDFPSYGNYVGGVPGGNGIRGVKKGADATVTTKVDPSEAGTLGRLNKATQDVLDSEVSDTSQLFMQTSMTQRDKVRSGSQTPDGRANEYDAPIASRIPGMRLPSYSGEERHSDMQPKSQDLIIRGFWNRTAGTGPTPWMRTNALYQSQPMQRVSPGDPYQGPTVPSVDTVPYDLQASYGYADEDVIY